MKLAEKYINVIIDKKLNCNDSSGDSECECKDLMCFNESSKLCQNQQKINITCINDLMCQKA